MLNKIVLIFASFMFLVGCGTSSVKPPEKSEVKQTPKWVNSVLPNDNSKYMYGMAIAKNREAAIKAALNDLVARLGTTIESSYESIQKVDGAYANLKITNQIKANVSRVKVNNYNVIKSHSLNYKEFAIMLEVDKQKFIQGLQEELRVKEKNIIATFRASQNLDSIRKYNSLKKLAQSAENLLPIIYILIELNPLFNKEKNLNFVSQKKQDFLKQAEQLQFFISGNFKSTKFVNKLQNYLAQKGFTIASSKNKAVEIRVNVRDTISKSFVKIAILTLNIGVYDSSKRVGGKEMIIKERYNNSLESVYKNAAIHFEQDILQKGINELIGIHLIID